uniref:Ionotropic receptor n=1 Tax=Histia rhodope TaxID=1453155 RepID=A0A7G4KBX8_9NEOP|nr:ionotropic receptor [Histia rhodope]
MKAVNLLALFIITVISCLAEADLVSIIGDLIRVMNKPSSVIATLCWPQYKQLKLYYFLHRENISHLTTIQFLKLGHEPKNYWPSQNILFLLDLNCTNVTNHLKLSNDKNLFRSPYRWFLIGIDETLNNSNSNINIKRQFKPFDIFPDSEVMIILFHYNSRNDSRYEVIDIYKTCKNSEDMKTKLYGNWDATNRFQKSLNFYKPTALQRLDLGGCEIAISYVLTNNNSIHHLYDQMDDHVDTITKVNFPTTNHLLEFLNATRKYSFTDTWGYRLNGTWNGMSGYLFRGEVEIGGSPMFVTSERISFVEYISNPTPTSSKFVFQQPKLSYGNNIFLLSFRETVWYCATALVILIFLTLFAVTFWEWKKINDGNMLDNRDPGILRPNVTDILILIVGALCQQGSPVQLKGSLGRIVLLVLFLALMFLYTSYSANIVALLQSSSSQIKTLEDLLHSRMKFGVDDTVYSRYYFSIATEPIRKAIYETKVAPRGEKPRFMSMEEGIKNMQKGLFAFHMEVGVGYKFVGKYFLEGEKCGLKEIPYLQVQDPWLAVRKNTPYKEMFKIG